MQLVFPACSASTTCPVRLVLNGPLEAWHDARHSSPAGIPTWSPNVRYLFAPGRNARKVSRSSLEVSGTPSSSPTKPHKVPIDDYDRNLRQLVKKLQATGAKLIWASTTPVVSKMGTSPLKRRLRKSRGVYLF